MPYYLDKEMAYNFCIIICKSSDAAKSRTGQGGVKTHVQGFCAQQGGARTVADSGSEDQESGSCGHLHIYVMVK